ncbi:hypothetical protein KDH_09180 [Dictyobacter sp. S3.2.2.5]|uniref:Uncharacterized protein n=1 Tax=Dictyobacter halimunensis TaxID=3026934 RepID=A0ABQ6FIV9_9CHLR|nr:hypothetical protein KDH_09180 [Dictyobacter sp. S3.2.2.5]
MRNIIVSRLMASCKLLVDQKKIRVRTLRKGDGCGPTVMDPMPKGLTIIHI